VGPRAGLDVMEERKISPLPGIEPPAVQPLAWSLYRLSYPVHIKIIMNTGLKLDPLYHIDLLIFVSKTSSNSICRTHTNRPVCGIFQAFIAVCS
jgi:hypothetical protein